MTIDWDEEDTEGTEEEAKAFQREFPDEYDLLRRWNFQQKHAEKPGPTLTVGDARAAMDYMKPLGYSFEKALDLYSRFLAREAPSPTEIERQGAEQGWEAVRRVADEIVNTFRAAMGLPPREPAAPEEAAEAAPVKAGPPVDPASVIGPPQNFGPVAVEAYEYLRGLGLTLPNDIIDAAVRWYALQRGITDKAAIARLSDTMQRIAAWESGLGAIPKGDDGQSWGLFHANFGGRGAGYTQPQLVDPITNTIISVEELLTVWETAGSPTDQGTMADVLVRDGQRPDPANVEAVNNMVSYVGGGEGAGAAGLPTGPYVFPKEAEGIEVTDEDRRVVLEAGLDLSDRDIYDAKLLGFTDEAGFRKYAEKQGLRELYQALQAQEISPDEFAFALTYNLSAGEVRQFRLQEVPLDDATAAALELGITADQILFVDVLGIPLEEAAAAYQRGATPAHFREAASRGVPITRIMAAEEAPEEFQKEWTKYEQQFGRLRADPEFSRFLAQREGELAEEFTQAQLSGEELKRPELPTTDEMILEAAAGGVATKRPEREAYERRWQYGAEVRRQPMPARAPLGEAGAFGTEIIARPVARPFAELTELGGEVWRIKYQEALGRKEEEAEAQKEEWAPLGKALRGADVEFTAPAEGTTSDLSGRRRARRTQSPVLGTAAI